jgi:hypothetical protein
MTLRINQKVICIKGGPCDAEIDNPWIARRFVFPRKSDLLTIRSIETSDRGTYLRFHEIKNQPFAFEDGFGEMEFNADHFRPIVDRKTDISTFTNILDDVNSKERVTAPA